MRYSGTFKHSTRFFQWTLGTVIAVITTTATAKIGGNTAAATTVVGVSQRIVNELIPTVYYTQDVWYAFEVINGIEQRLPIVDERTVTYFYSDI